MKLRHVVKGLEDIAPLRYAEPWDNVGAQTKIAVLRMALALLEQEVERQERVKRWQKAVKLATPESAEVNAEFRHHSRLKRT